MDHAIREAFDQTRDFSNKAFKAGCYAPWTSLYFNPLGNIIACCRNQSNVLGNVATDRLDDVWHGERVREMREHLAAYRFGGGCEFCGWMIESGDHKGAMINLFDHHPVSTEDPEWPVMMEFALSNTCNFACIQCCGDWSSTIRAHREQMPPLPMLYDDRFFADLRRYLPHLHQASFYGGEPFLTKENYRIWDMMIEDNLQPQVNVLTNGSTWNGKVERVLDHLERCAIGISLDAVTKEPLERIRINSNWEIIMANMAKFRAYTRARYQEMMISFSWMRQNADELGPMLVHCEEHDYAINVIRLVDPPEFSLYSMGVDELRRTADRLVAESEPYVRQLTRLRPEWDTCIRSLYDNANERQAQGYENYHKVSKALRRAPAEIASELRSEGRFAEAIDEARRTPTTHKDYLHALATIAHSARRLGRHDEAEAALEEAMGLTKRRPHLFVERAWLRLDQGRIDEGLADAQHALGMIGELPDAELEGNILHTLSFLAAEKADADLTRSTVTRWLEIGGDQAWIHSEAARALAKIGAEDQATELLLRALDLAAEDPGALASSAVELARLQRQAGDPMAAVEALDRAEAAQPDRLDVAIERAWVCFDQERFEACVNAAKRAQALASDDPEGRSQVGLVASHGYAKLGAFDQAAESMATYVEVHRHDERAGRILQALQTQSVEKVEEAFAS